MARRSLPHGAGSMPELIEHGVTGFLVDRLEEAKQAIERIDEIDRPTVRRAVADRFTIDRMADAYLALYRRIVGLARMIHRSCRTEQANALGGGTSVASLSIGGSAQKVRIGGNRICADPATLCDFVTGLHESSGLGNALAVNEPSNSCRPISFSTHASRVPLRV